MVKHVVVITTALLLLTGCGHGAGPTPENETAGLTVPALGPPPTSEPNTPFEKFVQLQVETASMYPAIPTPCTVKVVTSPFQPFRGEVVAFQFPDDPTRTFVKRIIGMPGDTVEIHDGHVFINGTALNEPYITQPTDGGAQPSYHVPADSYFVLGDNRSISDDSRYWKNPYVDKHLLVGHVTEVLAPADKVKNIR